MGSSRSVAAKRKAAEERKERLRVEVARAKNTKNRAKNRKLRQELEQGCIQEQIRVDCGTSESTADLGYERAVAERSSSLALKVQELTSGRGVEFQRAVLERFLTSPVLTHVLPPNVVRRKEYEQCRVVCNGLANAWTSLKYAKGKDHRLARNVLEAAVMSLEDAECEEAASACVGLNRRTIRRGVQRRSLLNAGVQGEVWAMSNRRRRSDALQQAVVDAVVTFWTEETRVSPSKKDVRRKRIGVNRFISHAGHWLESSQLDFYTSFKANYGQLKVSFVSFRKLRPFFIRRLRDFNSCCCRYHQEMVEIMTGFNNMRAAKFHMGVGVDSCSCWCSDLCCRSADGGALTGVVTCQSKHHTYKRASQLWETCLCPRPLGSEWHSMRCVKGECDDCGFHLIPVCDREKDPTNESLLDWRRFEMVEAGKTKAGEPKKVLRLEYKRTTAKVFLDFAESKIPPFLRHQHTARWQDAQYRSCIEGLQPGELMSLIDYAENYSFKGQNEVQSQHWYNFQLTILVHITYTVNPDYDVADPKSKKRLTEYFYYISDDPKHDSLFVQYCLNLHWGMLCAEGRAPARHIVWSDGCAAQFKGATAFFYISRYPSLTVTDTHPSGCQMDWHYWGSGHGKGPHDGAGACLKSGLRKEQLRADSTRLHNAEDVVHFLRSSMNQPHAAYPGARRDVKRNFILIGRTEVCRKISMACKTVPGSRTVHSVRSVGPSNNVLLEMKDFSCFCSVCVSREDASNLCPNRAHAGPWQLKTLEPLRPEEAVQEEEDPDYVWPSEPDSNDLASELSVGDHFAVYADPLDSNAGGAKFFVLMCTKKMYIVEENGVTDSWGGSFERDDEVVDGLYYHQQGTSRNSYVFNGAAGCAHIYSHLVVAIKFQMKLLPHKRKGSISVYQMSSTTLAKINAAIQIREERDEIQSSHCASNESDADSEGGDSALEESTDEESE